MTHTSRRLAGVLLILLPTVMFGGVSVLSLLIGDPAYMANPLRQDLWRAGHAHAGVWLILALVVLRYVDEASLSDGWKTFVRLSAPIAAILVPAAFFLSVLAPDGEPVDRKRPDRQRADRQRAAGERTDRDRGNGAAAFHRRPARIGSRQHVCLLACERAVRRVRSHHAQDADAFTHSRHKRTEAQAA